MVFDWRYRQVCLLIVVGCGGKQPVDPVTTTASTAQCQAAADHLVEVLRPGGADPDVTARIRNGFRDTCVATHWSISGARCFEELLAIADAKQCAEYLTIDQRDGFVKAVDEATK